MSAAGLTALLPLLLLTGGGVAVLALIAVRRSHESAALLSAVTLVATIVALAFSPSGAAAAVVPFTSLVSLDPFARFYIGLSSAASLAVVAMATGYFRGRPRSEEFYGLLLFANLGAALLVASTHFASFFLGLEILSVSLYALIAYPRTDYPLEAALKYLVLAAVSSAFLLFGIALLYAQVGSLDLRSMAHTLAEAKSTSGWDHAGLLLVLTAIGFKLGVAPFHLWAPDVFEGSPAPATAFIATVSKGSVFAVLLRYWNVLDVTQQPYMAQAHSVIALLSMIFGTLLALRQQNVKRLLAYSSIAHMGYLLVAFQASGSLAVEAVSFYLLAYFITTLGAFTVITLASRGERDTDAISDYRGMFWRRPFLAFAMTLFFFSLAGIPLTAGFFAKYYAMVAGVSAELWVLVVTMIGSSTISLYAYLRVVASLYAPASEPAADLEPSSSRAGMVSLSLLLGVLLWLGFVPSRAIDLLRPLVIQPLDQTASFLPAQYRGPHGKPKDR